MEIRKGKLVILNLAWASAVVAAFLLGGQGGDPGVPSTNAITGGKTSAGQSENGVTALGNSSGNRKGGIAGGNFAGIQDAGPGTVGRRMASALSDPDPLRRNARIAELLINLNASNAAEVLVAFENGPRNDETNRHFRDFMYAWGRLAGEKAIAYALDSESARRDSRAGTSAEIGRAHV